MSKMKQFSERLIWDVTLTECQSFSNFEAFKVEAPTFEAAVKVAHKRIKEWRKEKVKGVKVRSVSFSTHIVSL